MTLKNSSSLWQWGALLYGCVAVFLNWMLGIIVDPDLPMLAIQRRDIGAALALPAIASFCLAVIPVLVNRAQHAILESAKNTGSSLVYAKVFSRRLQQVKRRLFPVSLAVASVITFVYFQTEGLFYLNELSWHQNAKRFPLILQAIIMWTGMIWGILTIYNITRIILRFMDKHLMVDVFSATELFPIANTIYWNSLFFCFGLTLAPLFWLGAEPSLKDFLMAMTVLLILINLMFQPLMRANQIIVMKKKAVLSQQRYVRLDAFESSQMPDHLMQIRGKDPASRHLIDELISAREWPINVHLSLRFVTIMILPALTWIGSSFMTYLMNL